VCLPAQALPPAAAAHKLQFALQAIESVPKISEDYNPATWMLEVANHGVESRTGQDFAELYNNSDMRTCAAAFPHDVSLPVVGALLCSAEPSSDVNCSPFASA
jgi:hypothetical protein